MGPRLVLNHLNRRRRIFSVYFRFNLRRLDTWVCNMIRRLYIFFFIISSLSIAQKLQTTTKRFDRDRTRTCNPQIRSLVPYPLGHTTTDSRLVHLTCVYLLCCKTDCNSALNSAGTETFKLDDEPYLLIFIILTDTLRIADPMAIRVTKFGKTL